VATYYDIFGQKVQYLSSDPANIAEGQVWYNSTSNTLKLESLVPGSWASIPNLNTTTGQRGGAGITSAALAYGGDPSSPSLTTNASEEYNGSTWTSTPTMNTARRSLSGTGVLTSAIGVGGYSAPDRLNNVESYNGTSWSNETSYPVKTVATGLGASETAAIYFGGETGPAPSPGGNATVSQEYDGSTWTAGGTLVRSAPTAFGLVGLGIQTSGIIAGGNSTASEEYDGTSWTAVNNFLWPGYGGAGWGSTSDGLIAGGIGVGPGSPIWTALYDGTSWVSGNATGTPFYTGGSTKGATSSPSGLQFGASPPPTGNRAQEWSGEAVGTTTITTS